MNKKKSSRGTQNFYQIIGIALTLKIQIQQKSSFLTQRDKGHLSNYYLRHFDAYLNLHLRKYSANNKYECFFICYIYYYCGIIRFCGYLSSMNEHRRIK